jgi:hypothetical protein
VWNAKRVLIFLLGFAGCLAAYSVYALIFGGYNELAPLPKDYYPGEVAIQVPDLPDMPQHERKTRQAWGNECPELARKQYYDSDSKGVLIKINDFEIVKETGAVRMTDFSAALFPKGSPNAAYPEINTICAKYCLLTLDRPVSSISELGNRKIMQVELQGPGILITNNRKTPLRNDDITITIEGGSLFYEEPKDLIWTNGAVKFHESQPDPETNLNTMLTEVDAQGLDIFLSKDTSPNRPKAPKQPLPPGKYSAFSGVEKLVLKSNIRMFTTVNGQSSMFTDMKDLGPESRPSKSKANEKRYLTVYTNGKMVYDLLNEQVVFDRRPSKSGDPLTSDRVTVLRSLKPGEEADDRLDCEHLKLTFRRKSGTSPRDGGKEKDAGKEIVSALASGDIVTLTMTKDALGAQGSEMRYESPTAETGPKTILIGEKMVAIKDGHKIQARELHLIGANKKGEGKHAYAKGPGHIELFDKKDPERPYPHHLFWQDTLLAKTDVLGKSTFEKITLVGDAAFLDEVNKNRLDAHTLQIWLEETNGKGGNVQATMSSRHKIHKVEAFDNVRSEGPEVNIKHAQRFVIVMKDTPPPPGMILPDLLPPKPNTTPAGNQAPIDDSSTPKSGAVIGGPQAVEHQANAPPVLPVSQPRDPKRPRQPIFLRANSITAYVTAHGGKHELYELLCEDAVEVQQAAEKPTDKGLDIKGEWLKLSRFPSGDTLVIHGDSRDFRSPARMQFGEMKLIGPEVTIDQVKNLATVYGPGAMIMPSNAKLDGTMADKAAAEGILTITWMGNMTFDGSVAIFRTGVQAYQEPAAQKKDVKQVSSMKCELMFVTLDDTVSFKHGQKQDKKPRVEKVFCYHKDDNDEQATRAPIERKVYIEDAVRAVNGDKLQSYSRIMAREIEVNNTANRFIARAAVGQGQVDHLAYGSSDSLGPAPKEKPAGKEALVLKLTRVQNWEHLISRGVATGRYSSFLGAIEVFHVPTDNPNLLLQNNKIPEGGFYLSCAQLDIFSQKVEGHDSKTRQIMEAKNRVTFQTTDYYGTADLVKFDEGTDIMIFEGTNGNQVSLFKLSKIPGKEHERFSGSKILYNRRTQQLSVEGGSSISSGLNSGNGQFVPVRP